MSTQQQRQDQDDDDLDLLLSLQDRVAETPPSSPGYSSDSESRRRHSGNVDMSAFKAAVEDCMDYDVETAFKSEKAKGPVDANVEKFSGLRIRNQLISSTELSNQLSDIRFLRLSTIKNVIKVGDTLSGCWATVGVLTEKGSQKTSSTGKSYCIWKIGCLDDQSVSVFLFGEAYKLYGKDPASTVFAFFNANVRKDSSGPGFQLSVFNANQVLKIGTSMDYGVCKGRRKDGLPCTMVVNKRHGIYCSFHRVKTSEKYTVSRTELQGGNLKTAFRSSRAPEGVYMVDPFADRTNTTKSKKPTKVLSVEALKKALSNAGQVTTNPHSQGIRFLNEITVSSRMAKKESNQKVEAKSGSMKRPPPTTNSDSSIRKTSQVFNSKRIRTEPCQVPAQKAAQKEDKMIELEYISSDEDCIGPDFIFRK